MPADVGQEELAQGLRYLNGSGVPKNSWMASEWLWKAVAKHNNDAVLLLSDLYARGEGVPRSCEQARILLVASAKKGSAVAAKKLRSLEASCR
jgi:TPR repeat protein